MYDQVGSPEDRFSHDAAQLIRITGDSFSDSETHSYFSLPFSYSTFHKKYFPQGELHFLSVYFLKLRNHPGNYLLIFLKNKYESFPAKTKYISKFQEF